MTLHDEESRETHPIEYRAAAPEDASGLLQLLEPFVQARKLLRRSEEELSLLTRHGFVAESANEIIGFSAIEIYSRKLAEIQSLAVADGYQGLGIGKRLVLLCLERARDLEVMEVLAISSSEDFLRGCGFDFSLPDQKKALFCQLRPRGH